MSLHHGWTISREIDVGACRTYHTNQWACGRPPVPPFESIESLYLNIDNSCRGILLIISKASSGLGLLTEVNQSLLHGPRMDDLREIDSCGLKVVVWLLTTLDQTHGACTALSRWVVDDPRWYNTVGPGARTTSLFDTRLRTNDVMHCKIDAIWV